MSEELTRQPDEFELQAGDKKIRVRGGDIISMANLVTLTLLIYGGWLHTVEAKDDMKATTAAIKEQTVKQWQAQMQTVNALREANCLNRLTQKQKESTAEIAFCRQLGEGR